MRATTRWAGVAVVAALLVSSPVPFARAAAPTLPAIGTAGHCTKNVGDPVYLLTIAPGTPPSANNLVLVNIGTVISRTMPPCKTDALGIELCQIGPDFALVSIKPELQSWVFPTIAVVGGPCGAYTGSGLASVPMPFKWMHPVQPESV